MIDSTDARAFEVLRLLSLFTILLIVVVLPFLRFLEFGDFVQSLVDIRVVPLVVRRDDSTVGRDSSSFFNDDNVSYNDLSSFDFDFLTISNDGGFERDTSFELSDNVSSLFFLIPADESVEEQDTDLFSTNTSE